MTHAEKIKCEICDKRLKPHAMYYHMKYRHTDEKNFQCSLCNKSFKTKDNINRHMMRHNMEFKCDICGKKFSENSNLQHHLRMHTNPEEFLCKFCNKTFEFIDRHMKHMHLNKRERNLKCQYCDYATDSKQTHRRHEEMHEKRQNILNTKMRKRKIKTRILSMKTFQCEICGVSLLMKQGYWSHMRHYHPEVAEVKSNEIKSRKKNTKVIGR